MEKIIYKYDLNSYPGYQTLNLKKGYEILHIFKEL